MNLSETITGINTTISKADAWTAVNISSNVIDEKFVDNLANTKAAYTELLSTINELTLELNNVVHMPSDKNNIGHIAR